MVIPGPQPEDKPIWDTSTLLYNLVFCVVCVVVLYVLVPAFGILFSMALTAATWSERLSNAGYALLCLGFAAPFAYVIFRTARQLLVRVGVLRVPVRGESPEAAPSLSLPGALNQDQGMVSALVQLLLVGLIALIPFFGVIAVSSWAGVSDQVRQWSVIIVGIASLAGARMLGVTLGTIIAGLAIWVGLIVAYILLFSP